MSNRKSNIFYKNAGNPEVLKAVPEDSKYVLDIGCGAGDNARLLSERGLIIDGITFSELEAIEARRVCRTVYIHNLEYGLPESIKPFYDVIICSHVIEHIVNTENLIEQIKQIMIPKATCLIVAVPNFLVYKNRLRMLFGKFEYESAGLLDHTHVRWYTYKSIKKLLINSGFKIVNESVEGGVPFQSYLLFLNKKQRELVKRILFKVSKGFFGGEFIFVLSLNE